MWAIIRVPETRFLIYCSLLSSSRERLLVFMLVRMIAAARLQSPLNNLFGFGIVFPAFFFIMSTPPIIFAFSAVRHPDTCFPLIWRKSIYPIFTKFSMGVYWVSSLHGIAFGEDSSIANWVITTWLLLCNSFVSGHFKEKYWTYLYQIWYEQ